MYWLVQGRVFVTEYEGHVTAAELAGNIPMIIHEINTHGEQPGVHLVLDGTRITGFDRQAMNINLAHDAVTRINATGLLLSNPVIYPIPFPLVSMVFNILSRMFRPSMTLFQSWEAAIGYMVKIDPTLAGLRQPDTDKN